MKVLVVMSGGVDSSVLLAHHLFKQDQVRAITIDYGQRHIRELVYAEHQCRKKGVDFEVVSLPALAKLFPGSSQTDFTVQVPQGHYTEESMQSTVVPNRNMILLSIAVGHAIAYKMDCVSYAAHTGDHTIYHDCRPEFVRALNYAVSLCDKHLVQIQRPFISLTKANIVEMGSRYGVDFSMTYSCYAGGDSHCGMCGTCVERKEAFKIAGVSDPTTYKNG
jgi:7-cyano-7-deazaguanine synthase